MSAAGARAAGEGAGAPRAGGRGAPAEVQPQRRGWAPGRAHGAGGRGSPAPARPPPRPPLRQNGVEGQASEGREGRRKTVKINHSLSARASWLSQPRSSALLEPRRRPLSGARGSPGARSGAAAAAGPGGPPHLPLWRSRDEPGGGDGGGSSNSSNSSGGSERGGQVTRMYRVTARRGRGECQEVRAPRTCPAVRMRRAPAPQGKSSAFLPRPSSPRPS